MLSRKGASAVLVMFGLVVAWAPPQRLVAADAPPQVGEVAPDFELTSVSGAKVRLSRVVEEGPVVLVVLRGFPGYQCPVCQQQVGQYLQQAEKFQEAGAQVLFVYPGPSNNLARRAQEFLRDKTIPDHFQLLLDPDYAFTTAYRLRWAAPGETAYPTTFVIGRDRKITFAKTSQSHGGRTKPEEALKPLAGNGR